MSLDSFDPRFDNGTPSPHHYRLSIDKNKSLTVKMVETSMGSVSPAIVSIAVYSNAIV